MRQLVLYNVGMLIIDEAEYITAQFNNGDAAMVFVWINLMNISGVPLLLVANPEFEDVIRFWLKASMRFSAGCRMKIRPLPRGEEFDGFTDALNAYRWTRTKTVLTEEIRSEFYFQTQGILRYMLDVWRWTLELTISRGGKEQITARLMQEAVEKNGYEVREIITDMRSRDVKRLENYRDLRGVLPPVHGSTTPPPPPPKKPERRDSTAKEDSKKPKPRRGKEPCTGYMDVDRVAVRGEYSRHAFIREYFQIPDSKELYLS